MFTSDFQEARELSSNFLGNTIFLDTWIPENRFIKAELLPNSLTISRHDNGIFGVAFGSEPSIPEDWSRFSIETIGASCVPSTFRQKSAWEVFTKEIEVLESQSGKFEVLLDRDEEIALFLKEHAPDSSVMPGNSEIVTWVITGDEQITGVAAICQWESGQYVVASVAVDKTKRNQGIGKTLMGKIDTISQGLGISRLCLGVISANQSAIHLYENSGWSRIHQFAYFERA